MNKRYQVFVSSTYADLQEERQEVMQALLELDCIPSGMELFPAANDDQWTLIKKIIDDCDYYIVIIAGRYGSISSDGMSYTEMEYRYALENNKPIIAFLHKFPENLPLKNSEKTQETKQKLDIFCELAKKKLCKYWESPADLGSKVSRSLIQLIKTNPAIGWVRADLVPEDSAVQEILKLKKQVEALQTQLENTRLEAPQGTANLARGDELTELNYTFTVSNKPYLDDTTYGSSTKLSWNAIFAKVSPMMIDELSESSFRTAINSLLTELEYPEHKKSKEFKDKVYIRNFSINDSDFQTIKVQLRALGLITKSNKNRSVKNTGTYWTLTPYGDTAMIRLCAISSVKEEKKSLEDFE